MNPNPLVLIASICSMIAGMIHLFVIASAHDFLPFGFLFFALVGFLQVAWGVWFFLRPTTVKSLFGYVINGGVLFLWALARIFPAPFSSSPEQIVPVGIFVAIMQAISLIAAYVSVADMIRAQKNAPEKIASIVTLPVKIAAMVLVGTTGFFSAQAMEPYFPEVSHEGHHGSEEGASGDAHHMMDNDAMMDHGEMNHDMQNMHETHQMQGVHNDSADQDSGEDDNNPDIPDSPSAKHNDEHSMHDMSDSELVNPVSTEQSQSGQSQSQAPHSGGHQH